MQSLARPTPELRGDRCATRFAHGGTTGGALLGMIVGGVSAAFLAMPDEPGPQAGASALQLRVAF